MSTTITIPASQFASLVAPIMPLAAKDATLPILNSVLIEKRGDYLVAIATDRYRVGVKRVLVPGGEGFRALIGLADLRRILTIFKSPRRGDTDLQMTEDGPVITIEALGLLGINEAKLSWSLVTGEYPALHAVLREALDEQTISMRDPIAVNGDYLAEFRHAAGAHQPLRIWAVPGNGNGHTTKVIVQAEDFVGLLMTIRQAGDVAPLVRDDASWATCLGLPAVSTPPDADATSEAATEQQPADAA